jgi:hypothetical protein
MTNATTRVRLREALEPFVLAIDIGSTASRGDVFDAAGRPLGVAVSKFPITSRAVWTAPPRSIPMPSSQKSNRSSPRLPTAQLPSESARWHWTRSRRLWWA